MSPSIPITNHFVATINMPPEEMGLARLETIAETLIQKLNLNVVDKIAYEFPVQGITLAYILSQSHLVIHTWPELGLAHLDLATCHTGTKWQTGEVKAAIEQSAALNGIQAEATAKQISY